MNQPVPSANVDMNQMYMNFNGVFFQVLVNGVADAEATGNAAMNWYNQLVEDWKTANNYA
jgi:hypothetical protein